MEMDIFIFLRTFAAGTYIPSSKMLYPPISRLASHPSSTVLGIAPRQNHQDQPPAVTLEADSQTVQMPTVVFPIKKNIAIVLLVHYVQFLASPLSITVTQTTITETLNYTTGWRQQNNLKLCISLYHIFIINTVSFNLHEITRVFVYILSIWMFLKTVTQTQCHHLSLVTQM